MSLSIFSFLMYHFKAQRIHFLAEQIENWKAWIKSEEWPDWFKPFDECMHRARLSQAFSFQEFHFHALQIMKYCTEFLSLFIELHFCKIILSQKGIFFEAAKNIPNTEICDCFRILLNIVWHNFLFNLQTGNFLLI